MNVLRQLVKVIVTLDNDEKEIREYKVEDLRFKPKRRRDNNSINDDELPGSGSPLQVNFWMRMLTLLFLDVEKKN